MNQAEWLEMDSELYLGYVRRLKTEFKEEAAIATAVNGAMIRAEHLGIFGAPARKPQAPQVPQASSGKPASNTDGWGDRPMMCPECNTTVQPAVSKGTGKVYYKCPTCSVDDSAAFINRDGTLKVVRGDRR